MKILACYSFKGGVGKTSTAVNMAWFSANAGYRTLLVDLDPQGSSTYCFRMKSRKKEWDKRFFRSAKTWLQNIKGSDYDNLDVVPAQLSFRSFDIRLNDIKKSQLRLKKLIAGLELHYDRVILDCPPSISLLSESVFNAADMILVPIIPNPLSEQPLYQLYQFFQENKISKKKIYPFFSMVQAQKKVHKEGMQRIQENVPKMLNGVIPMMSDVEKMSEYRAPIGDFASKKPAFKHYKGLWSEVQKHL